MQPERRGFPQQNKQKAGLKGGSGAAWGGNEIFPIGWNEGEGEHAAEPDRFGVQGAEDRNQDAENVNGTYAGTKSGPVPFANGQDLRSGH